MLLATRGEARGDVPPIAGPIRPSCGGGCCPAVCEVVGRSHVGSSPPPFARAEGGGCKPRLIRRREECVASRDAAEAARRVSRRAEAGPG